MKKNFLFLFVLFLLTGCVKYNANMEVKKNKSMDFTIIYALDTSIFGDQSIMDSNEMDEVKKYGFTVSDYVDGDMKGYSFTKNIKNIDSVSSSSDVNYSLSDFDDSSSYIFTVKKGFFKNTYVANFKFDASDSDLNGSSGMDYSDDSIIDSDFDDLEYDDSDFDDSGLEQFSESFASSLDLSFNVKLPYAAISNNATSVSDGGKQLSWKLTSDSISSISFEFQLFNFMNILFVAGGFVGLLVLIIVLVIVLKKKKNNSRNNDDSISESSNVQFNVQQDNNSGVISEFVSSPVNSFEQSNSFINQPVEQQVSQNMSMQQLVPEMKNVSVTEQNENAVSNSNFGSNNNIASNNVDSNQNSFNIFENPFIEPVSNSQGDNGILSNPVGYQIDNESQISNDLNGQINSSVENSDEVIDPFKN